MTARLRITIAAWVVLTASALPAQPKPPAQDNNPQPILRLDAKGPVSDVTALAFSPDGNTLYGGGWDKVVYVWNKNKDGGWDFVRERALRIPIGPGTSGVVNAMAVSSDGQYLAVAGNAVGSHIAGFREGGLVWPSSAQSVEQRKQLGTIYVFHLENAQQPKVIQLSGHIGPVLALSFAESKPGVDPMLVSAGEDYDDQTTKQRGAVRVWNLNQPAGPIAERLDLPAPTEMKNVPRTLAAIRTGNAPHSLLVGIAWGDDVLRVWDVAQNELANPPNGGSMACATVNNQFLLAGGWRAGNNGQGVWQLGLWRPPFTKTSTPFKAQSPFTGNNMPFGLAVAAKDQSKALAIYIEPNGDAKLQKIGFFLADGNTLNRTSQDVLFGGGGKWPAYAISPQADFVAVAGNHQTTGIQIYKTNQLQQANPPVAQLLKGFGEELPRVRFYRKGEALGLALNRDLATPKDGKPDLMFDLDKAETLADVTGWQPAPGSDKSNFTITPGEAGDRKTVQIKFNDGKTAQITLPENQTPKRFARGPKTDNHPPLVALIIESSAFADPMLNIYNAETGDRLRWLVGHTGQITDIAFSDDGKLLASASRDRTVRVWWMEDLGKILGKRGLLKELNLSDKGDRAVVQKIGGQAQAALKANLQVGDVVQGVLKQNGELAPTPKAKDFYAFVSTKKPDNNITLQIQRGNQTLKPEVKVEQAVDERKPLFTLFFNEDKPAQKWSWLSWTPTGPFDSSDQEVEQYVGWHFNTKQENQPATFAEIGQYRQQNWGKGLLKTLIGTGAVPLVWPPMPEPQMSLKFREGDDPLLRVDTERNVRVRTKDVKAYLDLSSFPLDKIDRENLVWQVDGGEAKPLVPHESLRGTYEAPLSDFDWKPKPQLTPHRITVSLKTKTPDAEQFVVEQNVVYDPQAPPPPPPGGAYEEPLPKSELPAPAITSPASRTVLFQGPHPKETSIAVELTPSQARTLAGKMTFQLNGNTVQKDGKPLTKTFQGTAQRLAETLPLENGENRIRVRLESETGKEVLFSEAIVVYYRRPPEVSELKVEADKKNPTATVSCIVKTPEDLPLGDLRFAVNTREYSIDKLHLQAKRRPGDKTLWDVSANGVLLDQGENRVRVIAKNADAAAINPPAVTVDWQPPPMPIPPRPTVDFLNVSSQEPITTYREGQEFPIRFKVQAEAKLARVDVYVNGDRLDAPKIPEAKNGVTYQFDLPAKLTYSRNVLRVIAIDENFRFDAADVTLNVIQPPVTLVIDRLEVVNPKAGFAKSLQPVLTRNHTVEFDAAAGGADVILRGRIVLSNPAVTEPPYVKCWVNGFLQTQRPRPVNGNPREWKFATRLVLNQEKHNRLLLELDGAAESQISQTRCLVDCDNPDPQQTLHLVVVGYDPNNRRGIDTDVLAKQAAKAFGIQNNKAPAFTAVRIYPVGNSVRLAQINQSLATVKLANARPEKGDHQVVAFYYQGQEVLDSKNQAGLATKDDPIAGRDLCDVLSNIPGAHVMFLDVAQPQPIDEHWDAGPYLGMLKATHPGSLPSDQSFPLMSALETAFPKVQALDELPGEVQKSLATPTVEQSVPEDLKQLIIGTATKTRQSRRRAVTVNRDFG